MSEVIWKAFKLGDLFNRSTSLAMGANQKDLNLIEEKDDTHSVALISASRSGSGRVGYIEDSLIDDSKVSINKITFDDQWGFTFFQQEDFVITGGHNAILEIIEPKLKTVLDDNLTCYSFLSLIINNITIKSGIFGYGYKINNKLDREIILLPCLEVAAGEDYIWEENGKYYTLAVNYIKKLMDEAKEQREQKTIRLYEAEKAKYEAEKAKYEAEYQKERKNIVWKSFNLSNLFDWSSQHKISKSTKEYNELDRYEDGYVANITAGMYNEGIACYLPEDDEIRSKKKINCLTISSNGAGVGACFFHDYYIVSTGDNALLETKNASLQKIFGQSKITSLYFARIITKLFRNNGIFSWSYKVSKDDFRREIILLPCLEVSANEDYIWEENGKYYTLAVNYISYIYLTGRINYNQKLIDNYTYQY